MVDNTIAAQIRPFQMPNIGEIYGQAQNIQLNRMRMAEAQETAQERNALRGLLSSGVDLNTPEGIAQLRRAAPMLAPQFERAASERAYQAAQTGRLRAQTDVDRFKLYRGQLGGVNDQAAWDDWRGRVVQEFPQFAGSIPQRFSPQVRSDVAGGAELLIQRATADAAAARPDEFSRTLRAANILPGTPEYEAAMRARATNLIGGRQPRLQASVVGDRIVITNLDTGESFLSRDVPAPGAAPPPPPVDLRRPQVAAPTPAAPARPANMMLPGAAAPTLAAGPAAVPPVAAAPAQAPAPASAPTTMEGALAARDVREVRTAGERVGAETAARLGAQSDAARSEELGRLQSAIPELRAMTAPGGLLEQATGGGLNALIDRFTNFFNYPTPGAVATGRLEPVAGEILRTVPRFEGPQSNADVALYQRMAGDLANPNLPNATRIAAAREIQRLMEKRLQQLQPSDGAAPAPAPAPPPARGAQPARTGQRNTQASPTLEQFLARARSANPGATDQQLTDFWNQRYGGR